MNEETSTTADAPVITEESADGNTTINIYMPDGGTSSEVSDETGVEAAAVENVENVQAASVSADLDARSSDRSGMAAVVETIFGDYSPRTQTVTTTAEDGSVTTTTQLVPGVAGMDMVWIAGVISFLVVLSGFISILRVVIRRE